MDSMKTAVRKVSEVVFPGIKASYQHRVKQRRDHIMSSLPLQMCLYFNVNYSPLWFLIRIGCLIYKVPELAGFWMLTTFLQFPLHGLCTFSSDFEVLPWERVVDAILMVFIALEIMIGYFAVKKISNYQALKMKMQLYDITNISTETFVE